MNTKMTRALIKQLLIPLLIILTLYFLLWRETADVFNLKLLRRLQGYSLFNQQSQSLNKPLRPHILLIVADDLGFNDVGYHGSEIKTPVLDDLAKTGVRLENYYVQPICTPTRGQLMTGRYDIHTGLHTVIFPDEPIGLPVEHPTMADKLREAGYATHIVGKWHLGFFEKKYFPTRRGFDSFFGFLSGHSRYFNHVTSWRNMSGYDLREGEEPANMSMYNNYYSTDLFADKAIDLIQKHDTNKPLFLYLPFQSPHQPFEVPKKYEDLYSNIGNKFRRTYAGMVSCMDEAVGRVLHAMKRRNMWENTILVFTTGSVLNVFTRAVGGLFRAYKIRSSGVFTRVGNFGSTPPYRMSHAP